ncbi:hypothetical protein IQ241_16260 [Romeria aff. gracilis LEGE 07310]|uniref:Uncharacterized protein n=1 Tax=Vasconcelosia minhoensis LEGE 07310 TaxID=915328 RepID=A0A8J7AWW5_9CYAN|nr:hypothetical protein [Romeria gracilis]MBE9078828.1 hypothetical protein [Romeria aff. gracilis LEGE 07310]
MTSQKDQIQTLIAEINAALSSQANPRLPWVMSSETTQQQEVLAHTKEYLQSLQQVLETPGGWGPINPTTGQIASPSSTAGANAVTPGDTAEHVLQALLVEMQHLKTHTLQPLRSEIESLSQQRDALQAELRQLADQRTQPSATAGMGESVNQQQLNRFLESLMARLQANLSAQVAGTLAKLEAGRADDLLLAPNATAAELTAAELRLHPAQRLEQLRLLQAQSDQLLLKLDSTLQVVFEALQKSVSSYQESLAEGLESMHGLGRQGEGVVRALVSYLAQQLGQEASIYLAAETAEAANAVTVSSRPLQPPAASGNIPDETSSAPEPPDPDNTLSAAEASLAADLDIGPDLDLADDDIEMETFDFDLDDDFDESLDEPVQLENDDPDAGLNLTAAESDNLDAEILDLDLNAGFDERFDPPDPLDDDLDFLEFDQETAAQSEPAAAAPGAAAPAEPPVTTAPAADADDDVLELLDASLADDADSELPSSSDLPGSITGELDSDEGAEGEDLDALYQNLFEAEAADDLAENSLADDRAAAAGIAPQLKRDEPEAAVEFEQAVPKVERSDDANQRGAEASDIATDTAPETADSDLAEAETWLFGLEPDSAMAVSPTPDWLNPESDDSPDPVAEDADEDALEALFGPDLTMPSEPPEPAAETIESLSELLPDPNQAASVEFSSVNDSFESVSEADEATLDDVYIAAPAGEDLLGSEAAGGDEENSLDFEFGQDLSSQLDQDLLSLDPVQPPELDPELDPAALADWYQFRADDENPAAIPEPESIAEPVAEPTQIDEPDPLALDLEDEAATEPPAEPVQTSAEVLEDEAPLALEDLTLEDLVSEVSEDDIDFEDEPIDQIFAMDAASAELSAKPTNLDTELDDDFDLDLELADDAAWSACSDSDAERLELDDSALEPVTQGQASFAEMGFEESFPPELPESAMVPDAPEPEEFDSESAESAPPPVPADDLTQSELAGEMPTDLAAQLEALNREAARAAELETASSNVLDQMLADFESPIAPAAPVTEPRIESEHRIEQPEPAAEVTEQRSPISPPDSAAPGAEPDWFLGLDLGSTGLSAVLMNRTDGQVYPLYWYESGDPATKRFRLPTVAWLSADHQVLAVGAAAWNQASQIQSSDPTQGSYAVRQLKPLLKVGVPHRTADADEPLIQWTEQRSLPLVAVQSALEKLLSSLVDQGQSDQPQCGAVGLEAEQLQTVIAALQGAIVGYPTNWPDTYSFNIREVLLTAGLVDHTEQIFFVEDAIAAVLSGLPDPQTGAADPGTPSHQPSLYNCDWQGGTAIISAGAVLSEIALVDLPERLSDLSYSAFTLRSFAYAGNSLDQDIICQLLHPPETNQSLVPAPSSADPNQDWHWHADLPDWADQDWQSLGLDQLTLPQPGESDIANRYRLQQRLESSPLGQSLLEAAHYLKLVLQHQPQCQLDLGNHRWLVKRRELESRIFLPYIQRIKRHLNILLSQQGLSAQAVKQVICTGGSASLAALARWLRQKFPNATIIQDTYSGSFPNSCSRVAYGLANLARYPQVLDVHRQQYSDYFLLMELLRCFPQQPQPVSRIMQLLEQRGINTQVCQLHILALLGGHLPPGLIPSGADRVLISPQSQELGLYQAFAEAPLFERQDGQIYVPNLEQRKRLRAYLEQILSTKHQQLSEPLISQLAPTAEAAS